MRDIVMCGIPRSGSTLVWQVLSEVSPVEIPKLHPHAWVPGVSSTAVVTIRDPMDIAASLYRVRLSRGGENADGPEGMAAELEHLQRNAEALPAIQAHPHVLLRYEDFVQAWQPIWDAIHQIWGLAVHYPERRRIEEKFSLKANRVRAAQLSDFNEHDEHHIHGDHIGPVLPGSWVHSLPEWSWEMVKEVCLPMSAAWGYRVNI